MKDYSEHRPWLLHDHQHTVRYVLNSAYSNALVQYGAFGYTGQVYDAETGLHYYNARYYDAATGRFLSEDPIGFNAGDPNLYRYVGNNAPNLIDPTGMSWLSETFKDFDNFVQDSSGWDLFSLGSLFLPALGFGAFSFGGAMGWFDVGAALGALSSPPPMTLAPSPVGTVPTQSVGTQTGGMETLGGAPASGSSDWLMQFERQKREYQLEIVMRAMANREVPAPPPAEPPGLPEAAPGKTIWYPLGPGAVPPMNQDIDWEASAAHSREYYRLSAEYGIGMVIEPVDTAMTIFEIADDPTNPWSYAGILPIVPSGVGKTGKLLTHADVAGDTARALPNAPTRRLPFADAERTSAVNETLDRIHSGGPFPYKQDGKGFQNREGRLPSGDYKEYTVGTPGAPDRAKRRIVVDQISGRTYYSDDHYESFMQIDPSKR